jgi:hypothetical protein
VSIAVADDALGWMKAGDHPTDYDMGIDRSVVFNGKSSGYIRSNKPEPKGFGTYMQMFAAGDYRGKRMRFSAFVKVENVENWASLWMRVDGEQKSAIAFDNMQNRPIKGTRTWTKYAVVLDVDSKAKAIAFGVMMSGKGAVWIDSVNFEAVGQDVPVTDMIKPSLSGPQNLGFDQVEPAKR